jgi:hypothetical protein
VNRVEGKEIWEEGRGRRKESEEAEPLMEGQRRVREAGGEGREKRASGEESNLWEKEG